MTLRLTPIIHVYMYYQERCANKSKSMTFAQRNFQKPTTNNYEDKHFKFKA